MYFVDRKKIVEILDYLDSTLEAVYKEQTYHTFLGKRALERMTQIVIESVLDVGNMMIDGFIMRDPGGFDDIIDILVDESVLPEREQEAYKTIIQLRKMVVKNYLSVDHVFMHNTLFENKSVLHAFSTHVKTYLDNGPGAVNAFSNDNK